MTNCAIWSPAYASLSPQERQRAEDFISLFSKKFSWDFKRLASAHGPLEAGHWLPVISRESELRDAWSADVVWAMRGGYGCIHLLQTLNEMDARQAPLLIGYSDITVLHGLWQRKKWGPSCYAAMPALPAGSRAIESLSGLLDSSVQSIDQSSLSAHEQVHTLHAGHANGPLFAGCLSVLTGLVGGPAMPDLSGHILCVEDIDERPYAIDRMLWQLFHAGHLSHISGFIGGRFVESSPPRPQRGPTLETIMRDWANRLAIPFLYGLPFGHEQDPIALPCGGQGSLEVAQDWKLRYTLRP